MFKKYFAFIDVVITEIMPNRIQLQVINNFLSKINSEISFYSAENHNSYSTLEILNSKFYEKPKVRGFVFYSLLQFCYGEKILLDTLKKILKKYECIFIRENIILKSENDLLNKKRSIKVFKDTHESLIKNLISNFNKIFIK
jgi:hypothetical protein